jgi:hypothetical protein
MAADPQYYIEQGVRRATAARSAGLTDIPAWVCIDGHPPLLTRVRLDQLHSPKATVPRDYRYITRPEYPTCVPRTTPPPITVQPLGAAGQTASVPLARVKLI